MFVIYCKETGYSEEDWRFEDYFDAEALSIDLANNDDWGYSYGIREED